MSAKQRDVSYESYRACWDDLQEARRKIAELEGERDEAKRHAKEAVDILYDAIYDEDFQPHYDRANFKTGPALLGNLTRAFDAIAKARSVLLREPPLPMPDTATDGEES